MKGMIGIQDLQIRCIIGIYQNERSQEQEIYVDLKVQTDFSKCLRSGSITETIDYTQLAKICSDFAKGKKYELLETFAGDVLDEIFRTYPVNWGWIRIKKPKAIPHAAFATVELEKGTQA
jgi:7,8-dihydroneopterin aldolase/epimerase/oxygenase